MTTNSVALDPGGESALRSEVKIVLVGDSKCGKTSLVQRFVSDDFTDVYTPTGFQKYSVTCTVSEIHMLFSIWDTSGSMAYDSVRPLAYQDAQVFLLCFCIADPDSLENAVNKWYPEVREHCANTAVILCGCQVDLRNDREIVTELSLVFKSPITPEQALKVSRQIGATTYVETSSRNSSKTACNAFEIAALAALGRVNMNTCLVSTSQDGDVKGQGPARSKSKVDLKAELRYRAKSCTVM